MLSTKVSIDSYIIYLYSLSSFNSTTKEEQKIAIKIIFEDKEFKFKETPKVEVIIPNINNFKLLTGCINSFLNKSKYPNIKITVADTGSDDENLPKIKMVITKKKKNL